MFHSVCLNVTQNALAAIESTEMARGGKKSFKQCGTFIIKFIKTSAPRFST